MKRILAVVLCLLILSVSVPALAAGKLSTTQEDFHVVDDYGIYGVLYARIENTGDKPVCFSAGLLEIFDAEGETIASTDSVYIYGDYLNPGEYGYARIRTKLDDQKGASDVDDYLATITGKSSRDKVTLRLPVTASYQPDTDEGYYTYDYIFVTVTNDTDEIMNYIRIVVALLDADGHILYLANDNISSNIGVLPGSSVQFKLTVDSDYKKSYTTAGFTPASVDAIAYVYKDQ